MRRRTRRAVLVLLFGGKLADPRLWRELCGGGPPPRTLDACACARPCGTAPGQRASAGSRAQLPSYCAGRKHGADCLPRLGYLASETPHVHRSVDLDGRRTTLPWPEHWASGVSALRIGYCPFAVGAQAHRASPGAVCNVMHCVTSSPRGTRGL